MNEDAATERLQNALDYLRRVRAQHVEPSLPSAQSDLLEAMADFLLEDKRIESEREKMREKMQEIESWDDWRK